MFEIFKGLRITPILIVLGLAILLVLIASFYILIFDSAGGNGLGGVIGLGFSVFLILALILEQAIVKRLKLGNRQLNKLELILLLFLVAFSYFVFVSLAG